VTTTVPEDHYRLCVVRSAPVARAEDLLGPLDWLVLALAGLDPIGLDLFGLTTAYDTVPVKTEEKNNLRPFLESAEVSYPFGRMADDPTFELRFFNKGATPDAVVDLHLSWGSAVDPIRPGFVAELRLGREAATPPEPPLPATGEAPAIKPPRSQYLLRLFDLMLMAFQPELGFIDLPRPAMVIDRPRDLHLGWATYVNKDWPRVPALPAPGAPDTGQASPGFAIEMADGGALFLATRKIEDELSPDIARQLHTLESYARPILLSTRATFQPAARPADPAVAIPTFMRGMPGEPGRYGASPTTPPASTRVPSIPPPSRAPAPVPQPKIEAEDDPLTRTMDLQSTLKLGQALPFADEGTTGLPDDDSLDPATRVPATPFQPPATPFEDPKKPKK